LTLPRPPPASSVGIELNETSHFTDVGADEETLEEVSHPPMATAATTMNSSATAER
jgi:hypothetical protein